ncbi:MAG: DegT/DnrJ/EryC1/StrS family aminotransferase [Rhodospirillaceae bacterium]|nr:DegT/DnrJ/EryC1/StrS family aminotransferase [Rhodospirillaceae bacterium]
MIPIFEPLFEGRERDLLRECIETGWISSQGRFIGEFEAAFARRAGMPFAVVTSSCTTALHLALEALEIGPGDEVICPDLTFIAPANMIRLTGATPVLVDIDPISWGIDPAAMRAALTPRTRAVIVVHAFGHPADMDPILAIAREGGLKVIEDVAEAPDALYRGRVVGTLGDLACYSFFANKIMTTGEGGMVICRDPALDQRLRILRDHGMSREQRYVHVLPGYNYRMTNMQAAIGLAQLERLDSIHARRNAQAALYAKRFKDNRRIAWRPAADWCRPVHWLATVTLAAPEWRDPLLAHLKDQDIEGRPMIFPVHEAAPYRAANNPNRFPVSRSISYRSLHLPSSTGLGDGAEVGRICDTVLEWLDRRQ